MRAITYPGNPDIGHAWAYLPDLAETIAQLAAFQATLPVFDTVHLVAIGSNRVWNLPTQSGASPARWNCRSGASPGPLLYLDAPFVTFFREALEMRYLWQIPLRLDNTKLVALIGREPHTALDVAVRQTLEDLGCVVPTTIRP